MYCKMFEGERIKERKKERGRRGKSKREREREEREREKEVTSKRGEGNLESRYQTSNK